MCRTCPGRTPATLPATSSATTHQAMVASASVSNASGSRTRALKPPVMSSQPAVFIHAHRVRTASCIVVVRLQIDGPARIGRAVQCGKDHEDLGFSTTPESLSVTSALTCPACRPRPEALCAGLKLDNTGGVDSTSMDLVRLVPAVVVAHRHAATVVDPQERSVAPSGVVAIVVVIHPVVEHRSCLQRPST